MKKINSIINLFWGIGTNNKITKKSFGAFWIVGFVGIIITSMPIQDNGITVTYMGVMIMMSLIIIGQTFRDRTSIALNLGISNNRQVLYAYISSITVTTIVFLFMAIFGLIFEMTVTKTIPRFSISGSSVRGSLYILLISLVVYFLYFPLCFIKKKLIWWAWAIIAISIPLSYNLYVINHIPKYASLKNTLHFGGNVEKLFNTIPNAEVYFITTIVLLILSIIISYNLSCYFNSYKRPKVN